jgi:hypothetical protein
MKHAEKEFWRLRLGCIPFSPEALLWISQCQVYQSLLQLHAGKIQNQGNLKHMAHRCQINAPFQLSVNNIKASEDMQGKKWLFLKAWKMPQETASRYLSQGSTRMEDKVAECQILAIVQQERDQLFWHRLNLALGKHLCGRSVRAVLVEDGHGGVLYYETEEGVQEAIFNEVHQKCYNLAEDAPICKGAP